VAGSGDRSKKCQDRGWWWFNQKNKAISINQLQLQSYQGASRLQGSWRGGIEKKVLSHFYLVTLTCAFTLWNASFSYPLGGVGFTLEVKRLCCSLLLPSDAPLLTCCPNCLSKSEGYIPLQWADNDKINALNTTFRFFPQQ
jgi:hypothetical protein